MRIFIDLIEGSVSSEFPVKGDGRQAVKALAGERVEVRWLNEGVGYEMPTSTLLKFVVRDQKGGTLLAELTDFTAPANVTTGYYIGRLSFNTDNVVALLAANPTKNTFAAVGEMLWKLAGATDWECSDDITFALLRKVSAGDDEGDPLVLASGFQWLQDHLVAGTNVTLTVVGETIVVAATGGTSAPANACTCTVSSDGLFLEYHTFSGTYIGKAQAF